MEYIDVILCVVCVMGLFVVWIYVVYMDNVVDVGVWGMWMDMFDSLQNIKYGFECYEFDDCVIIDEVVDVVYIKCMLFVFFEILL